MFYPWRSERYHLLNVKSIIFLSKGHNNQKEVSLLQKITTTMETTGRKYPVGIQTFERLRKEGYAYIDKTDLVWKMTHESPFVFLSRPRRFGKSLLSSTLLTLTACFSNSCNLL